MADQELSIEIKDQAGKTSVGVVQVRVITDRQRWQRAWHSARVAYILAFATLFLPIIHFVVPPLAVIIGTILAIRRLGQAELLQGQGACPYCQKALTIEPQLPEWPVEILCPGCKRLMQASLEPGDLQKRRQNAELP